MSVYDEDDTPTCVSCGDPIDTTDREYVHGESICDECSQEGYVAALARISELEAENNDLSGTLVTARLANDDLRAKLAAARTGKGGGRVTLAQRFPGATRFVDNALLMIAVPWAFLFAAGLAAVQRWGVRRGQDR